jgi:hypothetical protein
MLPCDEIPEIRTNDNETQKMLQAAAVGNLVYFRMIGTKYDIDKLCNMRCESGCMALHWAAGCNQVEMVRFLIEELHIPVDCRATKKARGRTALHYAARNGHVSMAKSLVEIWHADPNACAKQNVTPFQLAVFQNRIEMVEFFVQQQQRRREQEENRDSDNQCDTENDNILFQTNDFGCGAGHWLAIAPPHRAGPGGRDLIPLARYLSKHRLDWSLQQKQGHTALHKAAWMGHIELVQYLHQVHDLWDDQPDASGNYAANLAEMGKHFETANYLREFCSRDKQRSCDILGIPMEQSQNISVIRKAYLHKIRQYHPDKQQQHPIQNHTDSSSYQQFHALQNAYRHLTHYNGRGRQQNLAHQLPPLLTADHHATCPCKDQDGNNDTGLDDQQHTQYHLEQLSDFQARLRIVIMEYGSKGLNVSNLCKKWNQVWPDVAFPEYPSNMTLTQWLRVVIHKEAMEVVRMGNKENGSANMMVIRLKNGHVPV